MTTRAREPDGHGTAAALRRAFDASFAEAPAAAARGLASFLAIRVGGDPYAVRLSDITALHRDWTVVPVPSDVPELLGVAGFRGSIAPVFDLGALLGYPASAGPRWVALVRAASPIALAFDVFEAHLRVAEGAVALSPRESEPHAAHHLRGTVRADGGARPIVFVASLLEVIARWQPTKDRTQET